MIGLSSQPVKCSLYQPRKRRKHVKFAGGIYAPESLNLRDYNGLFLAHITESSFYIKKYHCDRIKQRKFRTLWDFGAFPPILCET